MSIKINHELNPIYETIFLLYYGYDLDKFKNDFITQINDMGINGEEIYQKHLKIQNKYVRNFQKFRSPNDKDIFYFQDTSLNFYISLVTPFLINQKLIHTVTQMNDDDILKIILRNDEEIYEKDLSEYLSLSHKEFMNVNNLTDFINKFDLSETEKWKTLLILQNPQDYYKSFAEIILKNIPAYDKTIEMMKASLDKYIEQFEKPFANVTSDVKTVNELDVLKWNINEITPTLATASSNIIIADSCFAGLMLKKLMSELGYQSNGREYLLTCLKALSDSSKLEILAILKTSPKYSTELAAQLGLTPATVSYHMNTLLTAKMVYVEKSNGRYYYHLNESSLKNILEQLQGLLF